MKRIFFKTLSGIIGIVTFIPLVWHLLRGGSGASFAAFAFWTIIVGINTFVTIKEKGNYIFPLALTVGNFSTSVALLLTEQFWWGNLEWLTLVLVLICLFVWATSKRTTTIIISAIAITIAGIPQLVLAWNNPESITIFIWAGFLIASLFGILAGKDWSVKERLYSLSRLILYALVIIFALTRYFK